MLKGVATDSDRFVQVMRIHIFSYRGSHVNVQIRPPPKGRGTDCFWCGSRWRRRHTSLSSQYMYKQWLDSYQFFLDI